MTWQHLSALLLDHAQLHFVITGEENYRQLIMRVRTPADATLALRMLDLARKERAVLQQHAPFTFHTSQLFITVC